MGARRGERRAQGESGGEDGARQGELVKGVVAALRGGERARPQQAPIERPRRLRHGVEGGERALGHIDLEQRSSARQQIFGGEELSPVALRAGDQDPGDIEPGGGERRTHQEAPGRFPLNRFVAGSAPDRPGQTVELLALLGR